MILLSRGANPESILGSELWVGVVVGEQLGCGGAVGTDGLNVCVPPDSHYEPKLQWGGVWRWGPLGGDKIVKAKSSQMGLMPLLKTLESCHTSPTV